jgi:hypothetical protein
LARLVPADHHHVRAAHRDLLPLVELVRLVPGVQQHVALARPGCRFGPDPVQQRPERPRLVQRLAAADRQTLHAVGQGVVVFDSARSEICW